MKYSEYVELVSRFNITPKYEDYNNLLSLMAEHNYIRDLIRSIRYNQSDSKIGQSLSPGRVPFHFKTFIETPHKTGWWDDNSIECFWQSNKILQVKNLQTQL